MEHDDVQQISIEQDAIANLKRSSTHLISVLPAFSLPISLWVLLVAHQLHKGESVMDMMNNLVDSYDGDETNLVLLPHLCGDAAALKQAKKMIHQWKDLPFDFPPNLVDEQHTISAAKLLCILVHIRYSVNIQILSGASQHRGSPKYLWEVKQKRHRITFNIYYVGSLAGYEHYMPIGRKVSYFAIIPR